LSLSLGKVMCGLTTLRSADAMNRENFPAFLYLQRAIIIDLNPRPMESTAPQLGLLAKLSILSKQKVGFLTTLVSVRNDMKPPCCKQMGFDQVIQ